MLLVDGEINEAFNPASNSRVVRNGVCVARGTGGGLQAIFAISIARVSFHEFATFFRDLGCANALYLDGNVSQVHAPALGRMDSGVGLGPIAVVTEPE